MRLTHDHMDNYANAHRLSRLEIDRKWAPPISLNFHLTIFLWDIFRKIKRKKLTLLYLGFLEA